MGFFLVSWVVVLVGLALHIGFDRSPARRTTGRIAELSALWLIVGMGVFGLWGGFGHTGPTSGAVAASIGYAPSMFQWEVGWADIAVSLAMIAVARPRFRGAWTDATLFILTVYFVGDAIGHVMQWGWHGNTAPDNVWALPSDLLLPALSILAVLVARRRGFFSDRPVTAEALATPARV